MRAINHALTGAAIGLIVAEPAIALPVALISHFVCDAIPHYNPKVVNAKTLRGDTFKNILYLDALLCFTLVLVLASNQPPNWLLAAACAFVATSPDLLSIRRYRKALANKPWRPNLYEKLSGKIQWFEKPIGAVVELTWFVAGIIVLSVFV